MESLKELETALLKTTVPTLMEGHAEDRSYAQQFKAFRGMTDEADLQSDIVSRHLLDALEANSLDRELKVLSVGCGDGLLDNLIITKTLASCPTAQISYTGLDINPQFCTKSEERLQHLPIAKTFICENFETLDASKLETFDFIYLVHVHYYFQQLQPAFCKVRQLLSSKGRCVVIAAPPNLQINLAIRFWTHEGKYDFKTMSDAVKVLDNISISYKLQDFCTKVDLRNCFKDGWSSNISRFVLDFICGTNLNRYPDNITKLCIAYLAAATSEGPEEFVLPLMFQAVSFNAQ